MQNREMDKLYIGKYNEKSDLTELMVTDEVCQW